ncbi:hypothetical protein MMC16_002595 [Acarospora aff. strigata]|nr:hypothetical protein [Acarospora aff. strigata]
MPSNESSSAPLGGHNSNLRAGPEPKQDGPIGQTGRKIDSVPQSSTSSTDPKNTNSGKKLSMRTRLGASASGLMSGVLGSSSANGFPSESTASGIHGSKAQSSSSSSGPSDSSTAAQNFKTGSSSLGQGRSYGSAQPQSFRLSPMSTRSLEKRAQYEFDDFMMSRDDPLAAIDDRDVTRHGQQSSPNELGQLLGTPSHSSTTSGHGSYRELGPGASAQHQEDGAAVVALLSDPGFSTDDPTTYPEMYNQEMAEADPLVSRLSPQELAILNRIKAQLPQPPVHRIPAPTNPLNLLPNFDDVSSKANGHSHTWATTSLNAEESYLYLTPDKSAWTEGSTSTEHSSEGTKAHLKQWLDVLTSYQDEVWGDVLPLIRDAKEEVQQAISNNEEVLQEGPAVRRLAMVFAHLDASPPSIKPLPGSYIIKD